MTRAIILHGKPGLEESRRDQYPSPSNSHWIPWLQKQLLIAGHDTQTPEIHHAFRPNYPIWRREFERHISEDSMILVGHSCGAGFLVRWLSENPHANVQTLALVAPWLDPDRAETTDFFDFPIDSDVPNRVGAIHLFHSSDDDSSIQASVGLLLEHWPKLTQHRYSDMGHFCIEDLGSERFPDLLKCLLSPAPLGNIAHD